MMPELLRIGTRNSELARWQATQVQELLARQGLKSVLVPVESQGDRDQHTPLYAMGVQGVFTRHLDQALLARDIDLAVHSLKDVPVQPAKGICLGAILPRGAAEDVLICRETAWLEDARVQATIATGSIRRRAAWLHRYPNHQVVDLRGNIPTRLRKFRESSWQGALFAHAALERLAISLQPDEKMIALPWVIPAPGQGAIAVAVREEDAELRELCAVRLNDPHTALCVNMERAFLQAMEGGCSTPICAYARIEAALPAGESTEETFSVIFTAQVLSPDGSRKLDIELKKNFQSREIVSQADKLVNDMAREAAENLLSRGAKDLLRSSHRSSNPNLDL
ncbi:hydroxymethylbilane synthase [Thermoflavifilum aggregans]|uniref:Hydroxymethylbilane synthase n=1 Tax=Thermoflavifilum aggregans TaxID=454188 RepID=A0A2M9CV11_9BACT|nr:hydroxymethylbilane synthase [Thermoflavifilum aggregans]PJJ75695.1 hydroxymethylbilane synthase [Thermoflavifilum aggregans]